MMNKRLHPFLLGALALIFWLSLWEILARTLDLSFVFPTVLDTAAAMLSLLALPVFYKIVLFSLLRVLLGFFFGLVFGAILSILANVNTVCRAIISPMMSVIKATPVASFIMVLWCFIGSSPVPVVIGALMVAPLIYHNLSDAILTRSKELEEVCTVYGVKGYRRFKLLYLPVILSFLIPSTVSGIGLCWKASIAAEIIAYTQNSIGKEIYLSKAYFEGADLFAYTITVIVLSIVFEKLVKYLGEAVKKKCHL